MTNLGVFREADIFGIENRLKMNKNFRFKTNDGTFLSFILLALSILAFVAFGRDLFEKKVPTVIYSKEVYNKTYVEFNSSNVFMIGFILLSNSTPVYDFDKKYNVYLEQHHNDPARVDQGLSLSVVTRIPLEKCQENRINNNIKSILVVPLQNYYCLKNDSRAIIDGVYPVGEEKHLRLQVEFCSFKATNRTDCYDIQSLRKLPRVKMHYIFTDGLVDHSDYKEPGKSRLLSDQITTNGYSFSRQQFWFKNVFYNTDTGFILEDYRKQVYYAVDNIDTQILADAETTTIFSHQFLGAGVVDVYDRKYIKIQGAFAFIGGFITFFKIVLGEISEYLTFPLYIKSFFESLHNSKSKNLQNNIIKEMFSKETKEKISESNNPLSSIAQLPNSTSKPLGNLEILKNNFLENSNSKSNKNLKELKHIKKNSSDCADNQNKFKIKFTSFAEENQVPVLTLTERIFRTTCFKWKSLEEKLKLLNSSICKYNEIFSVESFNSICYDVKRLKSALDLIES